MKSQELSVEDVKRIGMNREIVIEQILLALAAAGVFLLLGKFLKNCKKELTYWAT